MKNMINYSPLSIRDLEEIFTYISNELMNPLAAQNTVIGIMDVINLLETDPESGARLLFEDDLDSGFRYVLYKNYIAFYHIDRNAVYIDRILYGKRDYLHILFP